MKNLIIFMALILSLKTYSQNELENKRIFVRVYNLNGHKIGKGKIISITESMILLKRGEKSIDIDFSEIGKLKTKHSAGNNILIGSVIGATTMGIATASPTEDGWFTSEHTATENALMGASGGAVSGALIGAITSLFKSSKTYKINGDKENWKAFSEMFENK